MLLGILYERGLATPEDIDREVIAFHHIMRMVGPNPNMTREQIAVERDDFVKELESIKRG